MSGKRFNMKPDDIEKILKNAIVDFIVIRKMKPDTKTFNLIAETYPNIITNILPDSDNKYHYVTNDNRIYTFKLDLIPYIRINNIRDILN